MPASEKNNRGQISTFGNCLWCQLFSLKRLLFLNQKCSGQITFFPVPKPCQDLARLPLGVNRDHALSFYFSSPRGLAACITSRSKPSHHLQTGVWGGAADPLQLLPSRALTWHRSIPKHHRLQRLVNSGTTPVWVIFPTVPCRQAPLASE